MAMPNSEYWKQRFTQLEEARNKKANETFADIAVAYRKAEKQLEAEVDRWYRRFMNGNGIVDMADAKKLLTKGELREFKWDVKEYLKYAQDNMVSGQWEKQLENASARYHISRLEALRINSAAVIEELFNKEEQALKINLSDAYQDDYYKTIYEVQKGYDAYFNVAKLDPKEVEKIISKPWAPDGYNFSERIWQDKNKLINNVHKELMTCLLTGESPQKAIGRLQKAMGTARKNAKRLVLTETAASASYATQDSYRELGVEKYEIVATLDSRTSDVCQSVDGKVFEMRDYRVGLSAPPFHPNCRTTTVPAFGKKYNPSESRAARDEGGKTYYVDSDMKYPEWKNRFVDKDVDKSGKSDIIKEKSQLVKNFEQTFNYWGVEYKPVEKLSKSLSTDEIVKKIGGGDLTKGSCSSLAFTYIGNKNGLDVTDFRGGDSRRVFATSSNIKSIIQKIPNVNGQVYKVKKEAPEAAMMLSRLEEGKEYYFGAGRHAAIVRRTEKSTEYLELQTQMCNGWHSFDEYGSTKETLNKRFGCRKTVRKRYGTQIESDVFIAEVDAFKDSEDFREILGYLNTDKDEQKKGWKGYAK